ncbi:MAG TPA: phosphopantetheine-binding protein [Kofleriaceae bacterium]
MTANSQTSTKSTEQDTGQVARADGHEPASASEKYMAALWSEIIGVERVRLPDRFLDIGGNSLTLNILLTRIKAETGAELDPQLFFDDDRSSLRELARELEVSGKRPPGDPSSPGIT